jgi:hypothetical protein
VQVLGIFDSVTSRLGRLTLATVLAIVPGVGHIYLGTARRGIGILLTAIGLFLLGYPGFTNLQYITWTEQGMMTITAMIIIGLAVSGLGAIGLWAWQLVDARKIAKQQIEA